MKVGVPSPMFLFTVFLVCVVGLGSYFNSIACAVFAVLTAASLLFSLVYLVRLFTRGRS